MVEMPPLTVAVEGRTYTIDPDAATVVGTTPDADIRVRSGPPQWLRFRYAAGWTARVLAPGGSASLDGEPVGPFGGDQRILARLDTDGQQRLVVEWRDQELQVIVRPATATPQPDDPAPTQTAPAPPVAAPESEEYRLGSDKVIIGGVGSQAEIQVAADGVTDRHASVRWNGYGAVVRDLRGGTGTFVDGKPVVQAVVEPGSAFMIGQSTFQVLDSGVLRFSAMRKPARLVVEGVAVRHFTNSVATLENVSFELSNGGLLAIIGPSGVGKSTLFLGLLGEAAITEGSATLEGFPLGRPRALNPSLVGFVPQQDATFGELTVRQTLEYCAELRLGKGRSRFERDASIVDIAKRLHLTQVSDQQARRLSGGERRRLNVAMELLNEPSLLMLDEPTSGLDEGLDRALMADLRAVAKDNCVVLVATHTTAHLGLATKVMAIERRVDSDGARGPSSVRYIDAPTEILTRLHQKSYADLMDSLRSPRRRAGTNTPVRRATPRTLRRAPVIGSGRAVRICVGLEVQRLLLRRRLLLGLCVLAPTLAAVFAAVASQHGLAARYDDGRGGQLWNFDLRTAVAVLCFCSAFLAMSLSLTSIVGDRRVLAREERWGVPATAVVLARVLARLPAAVVQALVCVMVFAILEHPHGPQGPSPVVALPGWYGVAIVLVALTITSMCLGLMLSAVAASAEQGVGLMAGVLAFMVILSGLVIPLGQPNHLPLQTLNALSYSNPTRWAVSSLAAHVGLLPTVDPQRDLMWSRDADSFTTPLLALAALSVASIVTAIAFVRSGPGRRQAE